MTTDKSHGSLLPMQDSTKSIFKSASRFFSGTLLSRFSGLARDIVMAFAFGTGAHVSAFLVAFRFAHLLRRLFGEGALQSAFVPIFESMREENPQRARSFFFNISKALFFILIGIIALGMLGLGGLLIYGHLPASAHEVVLLTTIMLPSLLFICFYGLNAALLQCHHSYFIPAISPVAFNIVWIAGMIWLLNVPEQAAMPYLSIVIVFACMGQWLFTVPQTIKFLRQYKKGISEDAAGDLWRMGQPMLLGVVGIAAAQINNFLDAVFARIASLDGPAFLWYSVRIQQLPLALFGIALAGALLPPLSRAYKIGNLDQYRTFLNYALKRTTLLLVPLSFAMGFLGMAGIALIYARGDFGIDSLIGTTGCLWGYALGLWPMGLVQVLAPAYYARSNYRTPTKASVAAMALNVILNTWFVFGLGWGAVSIAIATSISAWLNAIILAWGLYQRDVLTPLKPIFECTLTVLAASLVGSIVLLALDDHAAFSLATQAEVLLDKSFWNKAIHLLIQAALFALGAGGTLLLTRRRWV